MERAANKGFLCSGINKATKFGGSNKGSILKEPPKRASISCAFSKGYVFDSHQTKLPLLPTGGSSKIAFISVALKQPQKGHQLPPLQNDTMHHSGKSTMQQVLHFGTLGLLKRSPFMYAFTNNVNRALLARHLDRRSFSQSRARSGRRGILLGTSGFCNYSSMMSLLLGTQLYSIAIHWSFICRKYQI